MRKKPPRILLTNDDGITAQGLMAIKTRLARLGEVIVVAPEHQRSAVSHSITLYQPLILKKFSDPDRRSAMYAVDGTPADCVKLALRELLQESPDLVVSGINSGLNTGTNVLYSGTVAGALEASLFGVTSVALSLEYTPKPDYDTASAIGVRLVREIMTRFRGSGLAFNVNIPARPLSRIRGVLITHQEFTPFDDAFERREDPRGRTYFWIKGTPEASYSPALNSHSAGHFSKDGHGATPSDAWAVGNGYVSVTPLRRDLTHHNPPHHIRDLMKVRLGKRK